MNLASKLLAGTLLGAGAIASWSFVQTLKRAKEQLEVLPTISISQLSWNGLTIGIDVLLKNPTKLAFSIIFPFVKLLYKDTVIGSSAVLDREIKIPAYGQVVIDKIMVQIPMTGVFSVVFTLIKALYANQPVTLTVSTLTTIKLGRFFLPYDARKEVTIKN